jgi:hypothetical protein
MVQNCERTVNTQNPENRNAPNSKNCRGVSFIQ